jgi:hypothetical protein
MKPWSPRILIGDRTLSVIYVSDVLLLGVVDGFIYVGFSSFLDHKYY